MVGIEPNEKFKLMQMISAKERRLELVNSFYLWLRK